MNDLTCPRCAGPGEPQGLCLDCRLDTAWERLLGVVIPMSQWPVDAFPFREVRA